MHNDNKILDGLNALGGVSASLDRDFEAFEIIRKKMLDEGQKHFKKIQDLHAITSGKSEMKVRDAVLAARWTYRDQGLVFIEASRQLAAIASKMISISESMAEIILPEPEETP